MNTLLAKLIAVAGSVVLAMPPGWCCGLVQFDLPEPVPAKAACCHHAATTEEPSETQEQAPSKSRIGCCCDREAPLPEKSVTLADLSAFALPLVADEPLSVVGPVLSGEAFEVPFRAGPRLHVVKCVWRC